MANEKILNTRIRLKYDSFAEWTSKNPTLLEGELAIAYLAESHTSATPDNGTHPVLFKVGPGAFNSLPWASALAADVYEWAKAKDAVLEGQAINFKDATGKVLHTIDLSKFVTEDELTTILASYYTKSEVEGLIEAAEGRAATDAKDKADKALADAKTYADTEIQKAVTGGTAGLATEEYVDDAVAGEKSRAEQAESGLSNRIKDLEDNKAGYVGIVCGQNKGKIR